MEELKEDMDLVSSVPQLEDFKESTIWRDIVQELSVWQKGFEMEMKSIVDNAREGNPSSASVMLHMGDINGRIKAVRYLIGLPDIFIQVLEGRKEDKQKEREVSDE